MSKVGGEKKPRGRISQRANKLRGESARHRGLTSQGRISQGANKPGGAKELGVNKPGGELAKGRKSQTPF